MKTYSGYRELMGAGLHSYSCSEKCNVSLWAQGSMRVNNYIRIHSISVQLGAGLQPLCSSPFNRRPTCQPSGFVVFLRTNTSLNESLLPVPTLELQQEKLS